MASLRKKFLVTVSPDCIDNSRRNNRHWCIWALGITSSIRGATRVDVDAKTTRFNYMGHRYVFSTPPVAAQIAAALDQGTNKKNIQPWTEVLEDPISITPIQNRGPRGNYKRTGRYREQSEGRKCSSSRSRRWHGIKVVGGKL